ncbi:iron-sulfur cluster assembly scaffold protein [Candidatus Pelagibacter sp.]|jgi:nitrogen fixation NifU-like protein|nr:iron-sulfur cluster assembly scaffold protein [Candidatus Pelagibacter sp.]MDA8726803.1 iron-sulfur cluster assembly scaffold protein [Candidatus Pelagibacter bacterium]MDC1415849.1 iron-sulfur cluster assembly scaffold protein [Pelagibacteraceae bacterium]MDA9813479.1 iron-sulfur cluster assembly scaffold protein [Candidatus Pelagibacter sp.]MDA9878312.1 iron-sulfur cluster assembly scaffold protein [Candidatus Pelagibacter sp.]|tara:strand:+ start:279 stop:677 length:399 start_codon:yes stop_codon:yes gene_type:complete
MDLRILEIASHTENNKIIENFTHKSKNKNPLCGDEMEISLIVEEDVVKDLGYQCKSCVYCQASVSLLSRKIKDKKIEEIKEFIGNGEKLFEDAKVTIEKHWKDFKEILDKKNLSRKECLLLPLRTVLKALKI